jgi:hypothetical protein
MVIVPRVFLRAPSLARPGTISFLWWCILWFTLLFHNRQAHLRARGVPLLVHAVASDKSRDGVLTRPHVDERQSLSLLLVEYLLFLGLLLLAQDAGLVRLLLFVELFADAGLLLEFNAALLGFRETGPAVGLLVKFLGLLRRHGRFALGAFGRTRHEALHAHRVGDQREGVLSGGHGGILSCGTVKVVGVRRQLDDLVMLE